MRPLHDCPVVEFPFRQLVEASAWYALVGQMASARAFGPTGLQSQDGYGGETKTLYRAEARNSSRLLAMPCKARWTPVWVSRSRPRSRRSAATRLWGYVDDLRAKSNLSD